MVNDYIIEVDNVSMRFNLSRDKIDSLKEYVVKFLKKQLFFEEFWALKDVSFKVERGEVFGIIGLNGAGKSTLLKLIAGVLKPTKGAVSVKGSIAPLIELGAGFDMDLTARENIYMNGAILGRSRKYLNKIFEDIIEFSELHNFIDVPIKNFSSGMVARLGFAISTVVKPEILIVDEILSVGDYKFQEKCNNRINGMIKDGTTVLMVSHSITQITDMCSRALWLEHGSMIEVGSSNEVAEKFLSYY
jgi:ABC-2 type transport system ATP-binding protein/lipopolysaccharide transport system ATP-binding protein